MRLAESPASLPHFSPQVKDVHARTSRSPPATASAPSRLLRSGQPSKFGGRAASPSSNSSCDAAGDSESSSRPDISLQIPRLAPPPRQPAPYSSDTTSLLARRRLPSR